MNSYSTFFPGYSIGEDAFNEIPAVCAPFGKTAIVIGGKRALEKTKDALIEAVKGSDITLIDFLWYGGEAAYEHANALIANEKVKSADMVFAVGGGKAIDCCKYVADFLDKPLFSFPTIASTCAALSALGVYYTPEHVYKDIYRAKRPAVHVFISTKVIAEAPDIYMWAGIGDGMSKETEVQFSARGRENEVTLSDAAGVALSGCCTAPFLKYGVQAWEDCKQNKSSEAIEAVSLNIIINTGMVSNMVDSVKYNTSLGHSLFNSFTSLKQVEENHLHGEIVAYGTLVLLTMDEQFEKRDIFFNFYKKMKLPTKLADIEVTEAELDIVLEQVMTKYDIETAPYKITKDLVRKAILDLEEYNKNK